MAGTNFKTENNTFRKLFGNGLSYRIPRFQRDYSWTDVEWEDLWADIEDIIRPEGDEAHYLGYLVLQSQDERTFDVIDGQQRLTTLSIIVLAVLRNLQRLVDDDVDADRNKVRLDQIRSSYIGYLDPVTLIARSKLTLNRNNDAYYQNYLVPLAALPMRGFKASEHAMRKASDWFERAVRGYALREGDDPGVRLALLVEALSDRLFFTVITVSDELNAYKVFETLNARGVRLSATDLLKNYLFSVLFRDKVHESEMQAMDDRWERLVTRLGETDLPDFLRVHWMSRNGLVRQGDLFKTIRVKVSNRGEVFALLAALDADVDPYLGLAFPDSSDWAGPDREAAQLLRMFNVRQHYALMIAARRMLSAEEFRALLKAMVAISFRYNVIGTLQSGEQERVYSAVAARISSGEAVGLQAILESLRSVYPNDASFKAAFAAKELKTTQSRNNRIVRYLLCKLEEQAHGANIDRDNPAVSVEHVLPQNPDDGWDAFSDLEIEAYSYRLGNMTLLESDVNREIGNARYIAKRERLADSQFLSTSELAKKNEAWTTAEIETRQQAMARMATTVWRVPQLA